MPPQRTSRSGKPSDSPNRDFRWAQLGMAQARPAAAPRLINQREQIPRHDPPSYAATPIVTVEVGKPEKVYYIHKILLTTISKYFQGYLNSGFAEGQTLTVTVENEDEKFFNIFVHWIYRGQLSHDDLSKAADRCSHIVSLYRLGDRLMAEGFQNELIDQLRQEFQNTTSASTETYIMSTQEQGLLESQLGQFLVKQFAWWIFSGKQNVCAQSSWGSFVVEPPFCLEALYSNHEAARAVLKAIVEYGPRDGFEPCRKPGCVYHVHANGNQCDEE